MNKRRLPHLLSVLTISFLVCLGWHLRIPEVVQVNENWAPTQFATALALAFGALSLWFSEWKRQVLSIPVFLVSLSTIYQYTTGIDLGVDSLFVDPWITAKSDPPGRPALSTSLSLLGLGFYSMFGNTSREWRRSFIACTFLPAGISGIGYWVGEDFGIWGAGTGMAALTVISLIILSSWMLDEVTHEF